MLFSSLEYIQEDVSTCCFVNSVAQIYKICFLQQPSWFQSAFSISNIEWKRVSLLDRLIAVNTSKTSIQKKKINKWLLISIKYSKARISKFPWKLSHFLKINLVEPFNSIFKITVCGIGVERWIFGKTELDLKLQHFFNIRYLHGTSVDSIEWIELETQLSKDILPIVVPVDSEKCKFNVKTKKPFWKKKIIINFS